MTRLMFHRQPRNLNTQNLPTVRCQDEFSTVGKQKKRQQQIGRTSDGKSNDGTQKSWRTRARRSSPRRTADGQSTRRSRSFKKKCPLHERRGTREELFDERFGQIKMQSQKARLESWAKEQGAVNVSPSSLAVRGLGACGTCVNY